MKVFSTKWNKYEYPVYQDDSVKKLNFIKKNFKGVVSVHNRKKGINSKDFSNSVRDTPNIDYYKKLIQNLIIDGWQVYITGEDIQEQEWMKKYKKELIYRSKTGNSFKKYNFYCSTITDFMMTNACGNAQINLINKNKILMLNDPVFGVGWSNAIVSYNFISVESKKILKNLFNNFPIQIEQKYLKDITYQSLNDDQISNIGMEFINNINNPNYGISANYIGLNNDFFKDTNCKISNEWLKIIGYDSLPES